MHIAGSSGGSGASVAARIAPWSLCEDTGGSCRSPAIANGELHLAKQYKKQQTTKQVTQHASRQNHVIPVCLIVTLNEPRLSLHKQSLSVQSKAEMNLLLSVTSSAQILVQPAYYSRAAPTSACLLCS